MIQKKLLSYLAILSLMITFGSFYSIGTAQATENSVLTQTKEKAGKGQVINSKFGIGNKKEKIKKVYGAPDYEDETTLSYYSSKKFAFQLTGDTVEQVYSVATEYQDMTSDVVEKELGKPHCAEGGFGKAYWSYHVGKYLLTFQFQNESVKKLQQVIVEKNRTCNEIK